MTLRPEDEFKTIEQYAMVTCFRCNKRKGAQDPSLCVRCERVSYCGRECQKLDYKVHQHICRAITAVLIESRRPGMGNHLNEYPILSTWAVNRNHIETPHAPVDIERLLRNISHEIMDPLIKTLEARTGRISTGLVFNIPRCSNCLVTHRDSPKLRLIKCTECVYRFCVREECGRAAVEHRRSGLCSKLKQIADDERFIHGYESRNPESRVKLWLPPRLVRLPTPLPRDWSDYFKEIQPPSSTSPTELRTMIQQSLSVPLTIVAALANFEKEFLQFQNPDDREFLTIHVVGATPDLEDAVYEEINHLLPGVAALRVMMVGEAMGGKSRHREEKPCEECENDQEKGKKRSRSRQVQFHPHTYPNWLQTPNFHPDPPDLIIAFNSGICENPTAWKPTLLALLETKRPMVFTAMNEIEANADMEAVRKLSAGSRRIEWKWGVEKNVWVSGREHFDVFSTRSVWAENMYWFGLRGV